jgi:peptide/nickel transport system substrate-binding protein
VNVRRRGPALGAVLVSALALVAAACGGNDNGGGGGGGSKPTQQQEQAANKAIDIKETPLDQVKQGGTIRWAVDQFSTQWNYNQLNGPEVSTSRVPYGVMPYAFISDETAKSFPNKDFVTDAKVTQSPKQTVTLTLNPKAKWSDGTPITEKDYEAQWRALRGTNSAYQVSSSTGYDRIESVKQGKDEYEAIATFSKPFADWMSLWSPLYPAEYNSSPDKFNKGYLNKIPVTAGPFKVDKIDSTAKTVTMVPDANWWVASRSSTGSSPARSRPTPP